MDARLIVGGNSAPFGIYGVNRLNIQCPGLDETAAVAAAADDDVDNWLTIGSIARLLTLYSVFELLYNYVVLAFMSTCSLQ